jgi:hypothetical protein
MLYPCRASSTFTRSDGVDTQALFMSAGALVTLDITLNQAPFILRMDNVGLGALTVRLTGQYRG